PDRAMLVNSWMSASQPQRASYAQLSAKGFLKNGERITLVGCPCKRGLLWAPAEGLGCGEICTAECAGVEGAQKGSFDGEVAPQNGAPGTAGGV
ncbi:MAG: hypothetical protein ACLGGX_04525, partial [Bdellovibrionia bacterium]